jgi:hypothetical protein
VRLANAAAYANTLGNRTSGVAREQSLKHISVHDNRVMRYVVDAELERIVIHTRFEDREPFEHTDIVFEGVLAYHFEGDTFSTVLFDLEEVPVASVVEQHRALFEHGIKYCWPGAWNKSPESSIAHFDAANAKAFDLQSSCGLSGWVVARVCRFEVVGGETSAARSGR